ncbi:MAG: amidohydrolase family protein [Solobacterium sp.]|nr:amidohydrolase family protein [Solobacterium sp.]
MKKTQKKTDPEIRYDIIDNHIHFVDFLQETDGFKALSRAMDKAGVSKAVVFGMPIAKQWDSTMPKAPTYYLSNDSRCYYYSGTDYILAETLKKQPKKIRDRFYPFCCGFNGNDRLSAAHLRRLLELYPDFWCGIGEIMSRHDDLTALTYGEAPHVNHPAFLEIFDVAAEYDLPVLIHHNITAQSNEEVLYLDELKEALAHNRKCRIIWGHVGISRRVEIQNLTKIVDEMLKKNKNLWVDISWLVYDYYFLDNFPNRYADHNTMEDWVKLIEKHPDRFILGSDKVGHWQGYEKEIFKYYVLLDRLKPETAARVCRENILAVMKKNGGTE